MSSRALLPSVLALILAATACSGLGKMDVTEPPEAGPAPGTDPLPGPVAPVDPGAPHDDGGPPLCDGGLIGPVEPGDANAGGGDVDAGGDLDAGGGGGDDAGGGDVDAGGGGGDDAGMVDAGVPDDGGPYQDGTPTCRTAAGDVQCGDGRLPFCCLTYNEAPICRNGAIMEGPGCQAYRIYCDSADDCPGRRPCCGRRMSDSRIAFTCSLSADSCPNGYGGQPPFGQLCNPANVGECLGGRTCQPAATPLLSGYHRCL